MATVDTVGRKPIQLMGFTLLTIIFIVIGFAYDHLKAHSGGLLALYVLAQFFLNFGKERSSTIPMPLNLHNCQVPMLQRSLCPESAFPHVTDQVLMGFLPRRVRLAPLSLNACLGHSDKRVHHPAHQIPHG